MADGHGKTVQDLGRFEKRVQERLQCGTSKKHLAAQAIAVDLCGDDRQELLLNHPYQGEAILVFTQADSNEATKPYQYQPNVYNFRTYF
jgi:hypothetical protein